MSSSGSITSQEKPSEPHQHEGAEIIYVVTGQIVVNIDGDDTMLGEGDSMYFDSGFPHSYRRHGRVPAQQSLSSCPRSSLPSKTRDTPSPGEKLRV
ncbi:MAG: cupin domain-containing protein [Methyloceanibacter sp.]